MKEELVSIIIPVYNAEKYIEETIKTVKEQTYKNWEMILVDDKSTDRSKEIIKENLSDNIILIELSKNSGTAIARNEGTKVAKGTYISFLDADDLWDNQKIEKQLKFMQENEYAFTYTAFQFVNEDNTKRSKKVNVQKQLDYKEALKNTRILSIAVMIDLKQIAKEECTMVNVLHEDIATWWKLLKNGHMAYGLNEVLVYYRRYGNSKASNKLRNCKYRWELYRKVEKLSVIKSIYYFLHYAFYGVIKRI
ncbi:MAG: glycosyltransferase family 2 protein [Clostridia bacterium]|nr:glycosyltransferase family 2 protein [Clostridia bacterium]